MRRTAALLMLAVLAAAPAAGQQKQIHTGRVVQVIDGDSLRLGNLVPDIRLWGVDAPE